MRLKRRGIDAEALSIAIATLEIIEPHLEDKYLPSFLLRGENNGAVFHACGPFTMCRPDADECDETLRMRRTK